MAISKITVNGTTNMDVTGTTATAADVLSPKTFIAADGTQATGELAAMTLPTSTSSSHTGTSKATISRNTATRYLNIPTGVNSAAAYYTIEATPNGTVTPAASITGTGATVSHSGTTLTLSKSVSNTPNVSTAGYISSGTAGNSSVSLSATDANFVADNIKNGVSVFGLTGSYSGGGGTSKNVQILQSTTRTTSTSYTKLCGDITVAKTGTYDVYWDSFRSSTSGTWGTQLYIGDSAYGTAQATFSNHAQNVHLSNVSLTANQKVSVYGRSRGSNYYAYVGQLTIIEA